MPPISPGINNAISEITVTRVSRTNKNLALCIATPEISLVYAYIPLNPYFTLPPNNL